MLSISGLLTVPPKGFSPLLPFTIATTVPADALDDLAPDSLYSKEELLDYVKSGRDKCHNLIAGLTEARMDDG